MYPRVNNHIPEYGGARLNNYQHKMNARQKAAFNKLIDAITNVDSNVLELANAMVANASPAVRKRLMDFVVAIIFAESDAYVFENDESEGPTNAYALVQELNNLGILPTR